jgi:DNA sulfur modification protein DndD
MLVDKARRDVPKNTLSAGEKQIYAVAVLWALARTSGRVLPMIVDTPLARLDSDHRTAIIQRYFTSASHQVIVLSTDTEVDHTLLELLGQSVSHTFQLEYDAALGRTTVGRGYFGQSGEREQGALQQA